ncbi:MAG: C-GCAxxG-C-C family protein [Bacillota bacterium]|nr:C-GCAxxG-C-C family protein [Bacillota bacterium]
MKEFKFESFEKSLPRRKFLLSTGMFAAGAVLSACTLTEEPIRLADADSAAEVPAWPWNYKKLDPEVARKKGYDGYFSNGGCMGGAIVGTLGYLQEEAGAPFTSIPIEMFKYGAGGAVGWGTLCGALNGAGAFLNLLSKDYSKIYNELIGWYCGFPFPSDKHESYCKFPGQITTVSNSPLCHNSVTIWCTEAGVRFDSQEKYDRCAKLTGDVAAKAIELLNAEIEGKFIAAYKPTEEHAACMSCHTGPKSPIGNVQGKMDCLDCHDDHTK